MRVLIGMVSMAIRVTTGVLDREILILEGRFLRGLQEQQDLGKIQRREIKRKVLREEGKVQMK